LHLGIAIVFPLPWFGLGVSAIYLLLIPVGYWLKIESLLKFKEPSLVFFYDEECPLCNRTKIILSHFDVFNAIEFKGVQTYGYNHPAFAGLTKDELLDNIYSLTKKGKVLQGVDTYAYALKRIPFFFLVGILMSLPGIYHLAKFVYGKIAQNRYVERCTEDNCGYIPPSLPVDYDKIKILNGFTIQNLKVMLITISFVVLSLLQINVTYNSTLSKKIKKKIGFYNSTAEHLIQRITMPIRYCSKVFLGIGSHPVFMDKHFDHYNHIVAIEAENEKGEKYWLPIVDKHGMASWYIYSFNWVKWTFRVNSPTINQEVLRRGVRDFGTFWAVKNGKDLDGLKFNIYIKKVEIPLEWKADHLNNQLQNDWKFVGSMFWRNNQFISDIPNIENL
jgi:predicted DCC family thiol-disulfide oxidoreductase YuxK